MDWPEYVEHLRKHGMAYGRALNEKLWDELHPDGKPITKVEDITPELLANLTPEARQMLAAKYPLETLRALTGVF